MLIWRDFWIIFLKLYSCQKHEALINVSNVFIRTKLLITSYGFKKLKLQLIKAKMGPPYFFTS